MKKNEKLLGTGCWTWHDSGFECSPQHPAFKNKDSTFVDLIGIWESEMRLSPDETPPSIFYWDEYVKEGRNINRKKMRYVIPDDQIPCSELF